MSPATQQPVAARPHVPDTMPGVGTDDRDKKRTLRREASGSVTSICAVRCAWVRLSKGRPEDGCINSGSILGSPKPLKAILSQLREHDV